MPEREYEILINADGTVELAIHGQKGKGCTNIAKLFERIVGQQTSQTLTQEAYEPDEEVHIHQQQ